MATTYVYRTGTMAGGSRTTWTLSMWVKFNADQTYRSFFSQSDNTDDYTEIKMHTGDYIHWENAESVMNAELKTTQLFRDPTAWYNIIFVWDTTNDTSDDRMRIYVNGDRITSFSSETQPPEDTTGIVNKAGIGPMILGATDYTGSAPQKYWNGDMSHVQFVDGAALAPTEFGEVDSTSGIWKIKTSCYGTPGTNGFCLKMEDRTNLDLDSSSNAHPFATSGTGTPTYDNPSNNFCTMNPLDNYGADSTFTNGNNTVAIGTNDRTNTSTMGLTKGKWYFEVKYTPGSQIYSMIGIANYPVGSDNQTTQGYLTLNAAGNWGYSLQGGGTSTSNYAKSSANGTAVFTSPYPVAGYSGNQFVADDIVQVAIDLDNNKIWWGKNNLGYWGTDGYNGVPNTNTNGFAIADPTTIAGGTYYVACGRSDGGGVTWTFNFGNGYFGTTAVASTNADDAGIGSFEYDVPAGFYTICSKNLKVYG